MTQFYRRRTAVRADSLVAALLAAAVGLGAFYLARIWLQRQPLAARRRVFSDGGPP